MKIKSNSSFKIELLNDKTKLLFDCGCQSTLYNDFLKANDSKHQNIELHIGKCSYIEDKCELRYYSCATSDYKFNVGNFTSIGNNCSFIMNGGHRVNYLSTHKFFRYFEMPSKEWECVDELEGKNINIGSDVWIGAHSKVMSGANITDGVVLGTDTIVTSTQDLEPFGIYVGHPARLVRFRYDEKIIEKILLLKWWDKELSWIKQNKEYFDFDLTKDLQRTLDKLDWLLEH
ncbi:CatB-related O-acetyltransferase [Sulfurimonas sp.]|uniref:CatB-related O-acetyltransferase n=1 Tax=Sulfurimonas sp. TaxID=2022749 RepID=UPI0019E912AF|nr:CatB-related O-acetyltransferase [Sulfurimonas sp.]MBE0515331.1 CatB-related O-acetyltransferase [Sulfurimonas sp.]